MDAYVSSDQRYPDYDISEEDGYLTVKISIPAERYLKWRRVCELYRQVQQEIREEVQRATSR